MKVTQEKCFYGELVWIDPKNKNIQSSEYQKGFFQKVYCDIKGDICNMNDFTACILWENKEKE